MEPDQSIIDAEIADINNKIEVLSRQNEEDRDRLKDLRIRLDECLRNEHAIARIEKCLKFINQADSLLLEHTKRIDEQRILVEKLSELRKKRRSF